MSRVLRTEHLTQARKERPQQFKIYKRATIEDLHYAPALAHAFDAMTRGLPVPEPGSLAGWLQAREQAAAAAPAGAAAPAAAPAAAGPAAADDGPPAAQSVGPAPPTTPDRRRPRPVETPEGIARERDQAMEAKRAAEIKLIEERRAALAEIRGLRDQFLALRDERDRLQQERDRFLAAGQQMSQDGAAALASQNAQLEARNTELARLESRLAQVGSSAETLDARVRELTGANSSLYQRANVEVETRNNRIRELEAELERLRARPAVSAAATSPPPQTVASAGTSPPPQPDDPRIAAAEASRAAADSALNDARLRVTGLEQQLGAFEAETVRLREAIARAVASGESKDQDITGLRQRAEMAELNARTLGDQLRNAELHYNALYGQWRAATEELTAARSAASPETVAVGTDVPRDGLPGFANAAQEIRGDALQSELDALGREFRETERALRTEMRAPAGAGLTTAVTQTPAAPVTASAGVQSVAPISASAGTQVRPSTATTASQPAAIPMSASTRVQADPREFRTVQSGVAAASVDPPSTATTASQPASAMTASTGSDPIKEISTVPARDMATGKFLPGKRQTATAPNSAKTSPAGGKRGAQAPPPPAGLQEMPREDLGGEGLGARARTVPAAQDDDGGDNRGEERVDLLAGAEPARETFSTPMPKKKATIREPSPPRRHVRAPRAASHSVASLMSATRLAPPKPRRATSLGTGRTIATTLGRR